MTSVTTRVGLFVADNYNSCFSGILVAMGTRGTLGSTNSPLDDDEWRFALGLTPLYVLLGLGVFRCRRFLSDVQVNSPPPNRSRSDPKKIDFHFHFRRLSLIILNPMRAAVTSF